MADKTSQRPDARINVEDESELERWASELESALEELREAAKAAGPTLRDADERLARDRSY
jgi:hypothetical protein